MKNLLHKIWFEEIPNWRQTTAFSEKTLLFLLLLCFCQRIHNNSNLIGSSQFANRQSFGKRWSLCCVWRHKFFFDQRKNSMGVCVFLSEKVSPLKFTHRSLRESLDDWKKSLFWLFDYRKPIGKLIAWGSPDKDIIMRLMDILCYGEICSCMSKGEDKNKWMQWTQKIDFMLIYIGKHRKMRDSCNTIAAIDFYLWLYVRKGRQEQVNATSTKNRLTGQSIKGKDVRQKGGRGKRIPKESGCRQTDWGWNRKSARFSILFQQCCHHKHNRTNWRFVIWLTRIDKNKNHTTHKTSIDAEKWIWHEKCKMNWSKSNWVIKNQFLAKISDDFKIYHKPKNGGFRSDQKVLKWNGGRISVALCVQLIVFERLEGGRVCIFAILVNEIVVQLF